MSIVDFSNIEQEIEEGSGDFGAMPDHENAFMIINAELKQGNQNSWYFSVQSQIIGDRYKNRMLFSNFYVIKKDGSENVIAKSQYGKLCMACGLTPEKMGDPVNLLQKMYSGTVKFKEGNVKNEATGEKYPDGNEIVNPKPIAGVTQNIVDNPPADEEIDDDLPFDSADVKSNSGSGIFNKK